MPDELYCYLDIAKGNMFCNAMFLSGQAKEIFGRLKAENYLYGLEEDGFAARLAYFFLRLMPCIHSGKAMAGARGNSSAVWRCITDM